MSEKTLQEAIDDLRAALLTSWLVVRVLTPIADWMNRMLESR